MKQILRCLLLCLLLAACAACSPGGHESPASQASQSSPASASLGAPPSRAEDGVAEISLTAGGQTFSVQLSDSQTAQTFVQLLPLSVTMEELNGNEKFYYLTDSLPVDSYQPMEIKAGDLMLYGADCLVLFYENFSSPYHYTRLGHLPDAAGLSSAVGDGSVPVTFAAK